MESRNTETRVCSVCGKEKPLSEFGKFARGYKKTCKECEAKAAESVPEKAESVPAPLPPLRTRYKYICDEYREAFGRIAGSEPEWGTSGVGRCVIVADEVIDFRDVVYAVDHQISWDVIYTWACYNTDIIYYDLGDEVELSRYVERPDTLPFTLEEVSKVSALERAYNEALDAYNAHLNDLRAR